jgi:transposase
VRHIPSERDQQLAGNCDNRDPDAPAFVANPGAEPAAQRAVRLMPHPQPGQFDHNMAQAPVAGPGDALLTVDLAAAQWCRNQPGIGRHVTPVGKVAIQPFEIEPGRDLRPDPLEPCQQSDRRGVLVGVRCNDGIALGGDLGALPLERFEKLARGGRPPVNHRHRLDGILWICRTGAPWRDLPAAFGKWNSVWKQFRRWCESGVWDLLLQALADGGGTLDMLQMIDSTIVRAHRCAAGERTDEQNQALGRLRLATRIGWLAVVGGHNE